MRMINWGVRLYLDHNGQRTRLPGGHGGGNNTPEFPESFGHLAYVDGTGTVFVKILECVVPVLGEEKGSINHRDGTRRARMHALMYFQRPWYWTTLRDKASEQGDASYLVKPDRSRPVDVLQPMLAPVLSSRSLDGCCLTKRFIRSLMVSSSNASRYRDSARRERPSTSDLHV